MEYEGRICRSPMERASYMLPVAVGCSYNACRFCMLFKDLAYRELPFSDVEREIERVKSAGGNPKTVFLGDGNAFGIEHEKLVRILSLIKSSFDRCEGVNMDATVTNIKGKTDGELKELYALGVRQLYLGIESGLDDVLSFMRKDHDLSEAYAQIDRLHRAGIEYSAHIMTGVAGKGRGVENAAALAEFLCKTKPKNIVNFSMFVHKSAPLWASIEKGEYVPAGELENLIEERRLIELLDIETKYDGMHDCLEYRVRGSLPQDKDRMLKSLDKAIERYRDKEDLVAYAW